MNPKKAEKKTESKNILQTAKKRFQLVAEAEAEIRKTALDDDRFCAGEQWPADIKQARDMDKRPCLVINKLPQSLRQVTNDQRQNRPSMKVSPVDDAGTIEVAKILSGLMRHIEYDSNADVAYDTASDGQCRHGFGYFRVITQYCSPFSFEQDIKIEPIKNAYSVYMDPSYRKPDGSDANFALIESNFLREDFEQKYPNSKLSQMEDWKSIGDQSPGWVQTDGCRVVEYFYKEYEKKTIVLLSDGTVVLKESLPKAPGVLPEGIVVKDERETSVPLVKWCTLNGIEILEETLWPGKWIPIIPVLGDELIIEDRRILEGVIRHAKDPQRMYNYWATAETETIALAPKAPFIGAEGQFEGFEKEWNTANIRNHPFLQYKPKSLNGQPIGPPQRQVFEPPVQAITQARMQSSEDIKATTGIYDASLGNRSNEQSGVAIQRRNYQAQVSNFHFVDNFSRSLRHAGRIIIDLIPKIYDTARAVRIIHEDGEQEVVALNQIFNKDGKDIKYDLSVGEYDVTVSTGPSYQTKRQEAAQSMLDFIKAYPPAAQATGDLIAKNMDWEGAQEFADRLKKLLPPGIADSKTQKGEPIPPEVQQQLIQLSQQNKELAAHLNQANDTIEQKKLELESKERIALAQIESDLILEQMKSDAAHAQLAFKQEMDAIHKRMDLLNANQPIGTESGGPAPAANPSQMQQQPTGGIQSPGQPMGV